jgi:glutaminyl-peptide cyclotransferase
MCDAQWMPAPADPPGEPERVRSPGRVLGIVLLIQVLLGAALLTWVAIGRPIPGLNAEAAAQHGVAPRATVDHFNGPRAFALLRRQVEHFGPRQAGSDASRRLGDELVKQLPNGHFEPVPGGLRNIVGTLPGKGAPIVIGAHYDTEASIPNHVGANDGAAGTAAVVELARRLKTAKRGPDAPPLRFVLFDGEEEPNGTEPEDFEKVALRGSKAEAARTPKPRAMILLDYIAEKNGLSIGREKNSNKALWARLQKAADRVGTERIFPRKTQVPIIDDHVPFLNAGVPAIDLIDFDYPQRDTVQDDVAHVSERSLDAVGETVYELVNRW